MILNITDLKDEDSEIPYFFHTPTDTLTNPKENDDICNECGKTHGHYPNFEGVTTSIDHLNELLKRPFIKEEVLC